MIRIFYVKNKIYRNKITKLVRESKQKYYQRIIVDNKNNTKKIWSCINEYTNKRSVNIGEIKEIVYKENVITEPENIANAFNSYYTGVGLNITNEIKNERSSNLPEVRNHTYNNNSIFLAPITQDEVVNIISCLSNNQYPGYDEIHQSY